MYNHKKKLYKQVANVLIQEQKKKNTSHFNENAIIIPFPIKLFADTLFPEHDHLAH